MNAPLAASRLEQQLDQLLDALTPESPNLIKVLRTALDDADALLHEAFRQQFDIDHLVSVRAHFIDRLILIAWRASGLQASADEGALLLVAVGGYGRAQLHPHSDIDLLILLEQEDQQQLQSAITHFVTLLFDIKLNVGYSVRSLNECMQQARLDVTVLTNLIESRVLDGEPELMLRLHVALGPDQMWPPAEFFRAKFTEQQRRHEKYYDTEFNLEPNLKGSPGGLRDLQTIHWIAKRLLGARQDQDLIALGLLSPDEFNQLEAARRMLWRIRWGLHMLARRAEERLLFEHQRTLAELFGFHDDPNKLSVENFMQEYYRTAQNVSDFNEILLQHIEESVLRQIDHQPIEIETLNERFRLRNNFIEVSRSTLFQEEPRTLLEIFVILGNRPDIQGVRATTIRLIRRHSHLIDEALRNDPQVTALFMELLRSPHFLVTQLQRMQRYGILGRYLPEFGRVIGQMQHDLFHIYTVDAHTLLLIRNLRRFKNGSTEAQYALVSMIVPNIEKYELLYIAGLYHDIAKGRGGDHSTLGASDAEAFCQRHGLSQRDTNLVVWLVQSHLLMSMTAQRCDISDPETIHHFASQVRDLQRLDYLYLLTVADINATNHVLWNSWRASLMRQLYTETRRALRRGLENMVDKQERITETQSEALQLLQQAEVSLSAAQEIWRNLGEDYFLRESAADIAWHTAAIHAHATLDRPLVLIKETPSRQFDEATQLFIYTRNQANLFAAIAAAMEQLSLSIQDARIITSDNDMALNTYYVLDEEGRPLINDRRLLQQITQRLTQDLADPTLYPHVVRRHVRRQLKQFPIPTEVLLYTDAIKNHTVLEVITADRPGLLARIGQIFMEFDIYLLKAKIATLGERIDDVFFITDKNRQPIADPVICQRLKQTLCAQLDAQSQG